MAQAHPAFNQNLRSAANFGFLHCRPHAAPHAALLAPWGRPCALVAGLNSCARIITISAKQGGVDLATVFTQGSPQRVNQNTSSSSTAADTARTLTITTDEPQSPFLSAGLAWGKSHPTSPNQP